jgi:hypothetical protein
VFGRIDEEAFPLGEQSSSDMGENVDITAALYAKCKGSGGGYIYLLRPFAQTLLHTEASIL